MSVRVFHPRDPSLGPGTRVELARDESRYLLRVRRARIGDTIEVLDGAGGAWTATLEARDVAGAAVVLLGEPVFVPVVRHEIVLLLAAPEPKATLEALAAACAGGAASVVFVTTERSQPTRPSDARIENVLRATLRQSGRPAPPTIHGPMSLDDALAVRTELPGFVALPSTEPGSASGLADGAPGVRLLVGPEGGFSAEERLRIDAAGFTSFSLGPWTLRTEAAVTAGVCRLITA